MFEIRLDAINLIVVLVAVINLIYGLIVYSRNRGSRVNLSFFLLTISISLWGFSMFGYRGFSDPDISLIFSRILYLSATMIPFAFLYFTRIFPEEKYGFNQLEKYILPIPAILIALISISPVLVQSIKINFGSENIINFNTTAHIFYAIYISIYFGLAYIFLIKKLLKATGIFKRQIQYILAGTLVSTVVGVFTNLTLPLLGIFALNWLGQIGIVAMVVLISYSILKYQLFNIKVIATELLIFSLWLFILIRIFIAGNTEEQLVNIGLFLLTVIVGVLLIRNVRQEVTLREKMEQLAKDLEKSNKTLADVNKNLAVANEKLKELDQLKSEFVSLATHQIRGPLTAIKGYVSMVLEGDYGKVTKQVKEAMSYILQSTQSLVVIVGDFLDVSRIEQGRMKYDFKIFDFGVLVREIVNELKPNIDKAGLNFSLTADEKEKFSINGDQVKLRQVIANIIDNSVKYTPKGSVKVSVEKKHGKIKFAIKDTGVGIPADTLPKLFAKFSRAQDASLTNTSGTGLGLYLAKSIIEAHQGKIWAESEGKGKGSQFYVELDETNKN